MILNVPGVMVDGTSPITATPARSDLVVYQGVDTSIVVTVTGSTGLAFPLTSYTAVLTIKDRVLPSTGAPQVTKTYTGSIASNVITFNIPGSDLKTLLLVGYWWDVFVTSGTNKRDEVVPTGLMTVNLAVGA